MSHYPKVHLQFGSTLTFCGINVKPDWLTTNPEEATCKSCNRDQPDNARRMSEAQITARNQPTFGDSNYPGRGHLKCIICGRPYVEHPIRFCEYEVDA